MKNSKKIVPSKNQEEINGKKRTLFFLLLSFVLVLGSVATAVLLPYINTLPVYQGVTSVFDTKLITTETVLDTDNSLRLTDSHNRRITFTSTNDQIYAGTTETKYIFADKAGADSNVSMKFTYNSGELKFIKFKIYACNEAGTNVWEVEDKTLITYEKDEFDFITATYTNTSNIFINKVEVSYQLRVKN